MATDSAKPAASTPSTTSARRLFPWRARAGFVPGTTRKARQAQYREQIRVLVMVAAVAVVASGLLSLINYNNIGTTKAVSCQEFPEFCVPLAGGAAGDTLMQSLEAPTSRQMDAESTAAPGVVRYMTQIGGVYTPTIGNPEAPIHFVVTSDFACPHCQTFHGGELKGILDELVLTGQATFSHMMLTGTGGAYSEIASQAALCAAEQGAFWEMSDELFRLAASRGVQTAFAITTIRDSAKEMGLDANALVSCVNSRRYANWLPQYARFAGDNGVTGTPTVLVSYGNSDSWTIVRGRSVELMKSLTEAANAQ